MHAAAHLRMAVILFLGFFSSMSCAFLTQPSQLQVRDPLVAPDTGRSHKDADPIHTLYKVWFECVQTQSLCGAIHRTVCMESSGDLSTVGWTLHTLQSLKSS